MESEEPTSAQDRSRRVTFALGIVGAVFCSAFVLVGLVIHAAILTSFYIALTIGYVAVLGLVSRGRVRVAGGLMLTVSLIGVTGLASMLGPGSMVELVYLLLAAFPYYVLVVPRREHRLVLLMTPLACYGLLSVSDYGLLPRLELSPLLLDMLRWSVLLAAFVVAALMFEASLRERDEKRDVEARLEATKRQAAIDEHLRQVQKLESLGVLAGGIAHDFNNLLTGVLANASFVAEEIEPGSLVAECIGEISASATAAAELCHQMLAYAGRGALVVGPIDLAELVNSTAKLLGLSVNKRARLLIEPASGPLLVNGDATQLRQVLMNLVMNGSDALGGEGGEIRVSLSRVEGSPELFARCFRLPEQPHGAFALIEVRDDGQGIAPELLGRLFEPFFSTKSAGRGLGLSAVLGIVTGHRGTLEVVSTVGVGTSFRVFLPLYEGVPSVVSHSGSSGALKLRGRALVVDDEPSVRASLVRALERIGLDVESAVDGQDALAKLEDLDNLRVLVLDATMPRLGGREVLERLRKRTPTLPVLLVSGFDQSEIQATHGSDRHLAFLHKPFTVEQLRSALHDLLQR